MCQRRLPADRKSSRAENSESPRGRQEPPSRRFNMLINTIYLVLVTISLAAFASASYQLPIQHRVAPARHRQNQVAASLLEEAAASSDAIRRSDEDQQQHHQHQPQFKRYAPEPQIDESEQLRQLHRAVDTVAQLLNEEERQRGANPGPNNGPHELISESSIRQAIEELEKVQQQERQSALIAESRRAPAAVEPLNSPQALHAAKESNMEGYIDELGDSFIDDQLVAASQEAEQMIHEPTRERLSPNQQAPDLRQQPADSQAKTLTYTSTEAPSSQKHRENTSASDQSSLFVGQLDSLTSELGPALTNDFYTFHAEATGADRGELAPQSHPDSNLKHDSAKASQSSEQSDLATAAQTRNTVQHDHQPTPNFGQDTGTIRFDFSQPTNFESQQPRLIQQQANQEALVRAFRQQTGANDNQFPSSTLVPVANPDDFWRPTNNMNQNVNDDIGQQYNRARDIQQGVPQLPAPRFQSSPPSSQFSQPGASSRQPQHVHFTGHSIIPANDQQSFPPPPQPVGINNGRGAPFSSTTAPIISVLSGSDTSRGNSVTWNPPASLNPPAPAQQVFNQPFPTSTQSSQPPGGEIMTQFFPNPSRGPSSPLFRGAFQDAPGNNQAPPSNFQPGPSPNFAETTEANSLPDSTVEERFIPTTTQWSPPASSQPTIERDVSDSNLRSSVRSSQASQPFFSPDDLINPTSTSAPINTEPPRIFRNNSPIATTTSTTLAPPSTTTNSTKKEDMVIYYYYYYDDNKNATVVAKNVSSSTAASSPVPLDSAIEADGGVEDTPYMEDPVPISTLKPQTNQRTNHPSSSTTSTTTSSSLQPSPGNFESTTSRSRVQSGSSRAPIVSDPASHSRTSQFDRGTPETSSQPDLFKQPNINQNFKQPVEDQPRLSSPSFARPQSRQPVQEVVSSTQIPFSQPPSAVKPGNRLSNSFEANTNNRFVSTETSRISNSKPELISHQPVAGATPVNSKLQADVIKNVLKGVSNSIPRQHVSSSTVQPAPASTSSSRGPLSNASRYGTNSNLVMDPYGLDPAAPATLTHSTHSSTTDHQANQHHKSWQQSGNQNANHGIHAIHQAARKPSPVTEAPVVSSSTTTENQPLHRSQPTTATRSSSTQHFSSQRNSNNAVASQTPVRVSTPSSPRSGTGPNTQSISPGRQTFPESISVPPNELTNLPEVEAPRRITQQAPQQALQEQPPPNLLKLQTNRLNSPNTIDSTNNKLVAASEESQSFKKESSRIQSNNGRPSTPEGNTGNGFTRSPLQSTTVAPIVSTSSSRVQSSTLERKLVSSSTPQSTTSTSVSKSFVTPQQIQVTTSVSPPTITSSPANMSSSMGQSPAPSNTTPTQAQQNTVTATVSTQPSTTSTNAPQESSSTTESADSASTSTRKKFGNRNNRFQTRLSANAARSSTTTSTTTPAPSITSTTRRPTSSTTRKTSKQLFAGRRRLSSPTLTSSSASSLTPSSLSVSSTDGTSSSANASPVTTSTSSVSSVVETSSSPSASSPSRSRFGSSSSTRGRLSTASPTNQEQNGSSTQKPSLFAATRASTKPRLPFLKGNKPSGGGSGPDNTVLAEGAVVASSNSSSDSLPSNSIDKAADSNSDNTEETGVDIPAGTDENEPTEMKREPAASSQPNTTSIVEVTSAPNLTSSSSQTSESSAGRANPKLKRPLFISRQRSSSLFGNRRSNSTSTS